ncbi:MAG: serine/threonine-protein kinase [Myxococcota bacterium]
MEAAVVSSPGLPAGTRFGEFVAVRPLAAGGMAELYLAARARPKGAPELVAVKRLLPHLGWDPEFVRMFLDEVRIIADLDHPNIVRVVDFGVGEGGHYLAMEYLHGRTLRAIQRSMRDAGPLPLAFSVSTVMEIAAGLHAAHEHRDTDGNAVEVVHRDVSPSNVMITFDGQVKLLDFGIARVTEQTQLTRAGTLKGKVGYMSPEQCRGDRVDRRSDVFGLGILLYELTVGRRAFYAENDYAVIGKVVDGDYVRPGRLVEGYPVALEAVIARALQVDPAERHSSAAVLADELARYVAGARLDLSAEAREAVLRERFGSEPVPRVDLATITAGAEPPKAAGSWLRWAAMAGLGLFIGGAGFVIGMARSSESPAAEAVTPDSSVPAASSEPVQVSDPSAGSSAEGSEPVERIIEESEQFEEAEEAEEAASDPQEAGPAAGTRSKRRPRSRRRPKGRPASPPAGDPDALLPPTWREQ